jgi:ribosome-associated toxin RatA of RatAB toxin-antitoxin module
MFKQIVFVFLLWMASMATWGQSEYDVIVNSTFSPVLSDAQEKINEKANIVDTVKVTKPVEYNIIAPVYLTRFIPEPIKPPKIGKDQVSRLYRNFVKLGFGNYWTPYLDFEINSLRSTKLAYGGRIFHHSSWGKIKTYAPASYSDTKMEAYVQKFFKNYTLSTIAAYNNVLAHCYGFQPDSIFPQGLDYKLKAKDIRRQYHHINLNVDFSNNDIDKNRLNQRYAINYDFLTDNTPKTYEHQLGMTVALNHDVTLKRSFSLNVGGEMGFNYFHNRWNNARLSDNAITNINPHVTFKYEEYFIKVGFDALLHFQQQEKTRFHFYPDIEARLHIVPQIFTFYAGMDGGMKRNSYLSFMQENPYLSDFVNLGFTDEKAKIFAGIQLGISRSLSIGARSSFGFYSGIPFFINDTLQSFVMQLQDTAIALYLNNTFNVVEDRAKQFNVHFDLRYQYKSQLWFVLNLDYNKYFLSIDLLEAWYKPEFIAEFDISYLLLEKFLFGLDFYVHTGAKYPEFIHGNIAPRTMKAVFDFNFSFEYLWSKRLSFFANVNNFAYQRNYFYHDYPSQRINCLLGVKYNFGGESLLKK